MLVFLVIFFFYVQVYRESLLFVIPAFGGTVSWEGDGAPFEENDESITHQVCCYFCMAESLTDLWYPTSHKRKTFICITGLTGVLVYFVDC